MQQQQNGAAGSSQEPHVGSSKPQHKAWHTAVDHQSTRASMMERVTGWLQQRRPNASPDWQYRLPHMVKQLENELYMQAETLVEYSDPLTLEERLKKLADSRGYDKQAAQQPGVPNGAVPGASGSTGQGKGKSGGTGSGSGEAPMQPARQNDVGGENANPNLPSKNKTKQIT